MEFTHWSGQSHSRVPLRIPFVVSVIYVYISLSAFTFTVSFTIVFAFAFVFVFSLFSLWHCRWASFVQWLPLLLLRLRSRLFHHYSASIAGRRPPSSRKAGSFALVATLAYAFVAGERYSRILHYSLLFSINACFSFWMLSVCMLILFGWIFLSMLCYFAFYTYNSFLVFWFF